MRTNINENVRLKSLSIGKINMQCHKFIDFRGKLTGFFSINSIDEIS